MKIWVITRIVLLLIVVFRLQVGILLLITNVVCFVLAWSLRILSINLLCSILLVIAILLLLNLNLVALMVNLVFSFLNVFTLIHYLLPWSRSWSFLPWISRQSWNFSFPIILFYKSLVVFIHCIIKLLSKFLLVSFQFIIFTLTWRYIRVLTQTLVLRNSLITTLFVHRFDQFLECTIEGH